MLVPTANLPCHHEKSSQPSVTAGPGLLDYPIDFLTVAASHLQSYWCLPGLALMYLPNRNCVEHTLPEVS